MATAPSEAGTMIPGEEIPENIDYEAEARKMGWTDIDGFKGDPKHHLDAETFYKRSIEYMPIAKATIKNLTAKIDRMEKDMKRSAEFFSKAEERAYERAIADIKAKQEAAVEAGDIAAFRAANREAEELRKDMKPKAQEEEDDDPEARAKEFADWGKANKWYATNPVMQNYADSQAAIIAKRKGGFLDRTDLDAVTEKVREQFEDAFPEAFGAEPAKPAKRSAVDGGGTRRGPGGGGKTFNDLPPEARSACDRWVKQGLIKSREDYVRNYAW